MKRERTRKITTDEDPRVDSVPHVWSNQLAYRRPRQKSLAIRRRSRCIAGRLSFKPHQAETLYWPFLRMRNDAHRRAEPGASKWIGIRHHTPGITLIRHRLMILLGLNQENIRDYR